ncbi:MAG: AMP-binding protein [Thermodesulfobacteriota bacterium]|nr:AMP-binding protein [Thermodesulfobacteriota bacterium]
MIKARIPAQNPDANLTDYDRARQAFDWSAVEAKFPSLVAGRTNIIAESIDKWANDETTAANTAMIFERYGAASTLRYRDLKAMSSRWAALFTEHGFLPGDRMLILLPPCREFFYAMAACARAGIVFCPLFASAGFYEIEACVHDITPRGIITSADLIDKVPSECAEAAGRIYITAEPPGHYGNEVALQDAAAAMPTDVPALMLPPEGPLYIVYTSGSTRPPKGVVHCHRDMVGIIASARWALDLHPDDIVWTDADPAWVTGTVYAAFAPWLLGVTSLVSEDPFSAANGYRLLETHRVNVWYTTPRTVRTLMEAGEDLPTRYDLTAIRHIACVGAPLMPDLFYWVKKNIRCNPHDTWWMSETGIICIANLPALDIKPGAMGMPLPGIDAAVLDENGDPLPALSLGELALKPEWPGMMTGVWNNLERFEGYFNGDWFLTGDIALVDEEGYFYHQGRNDDILKTSENRTIGPFEIEKALCFHPAVAEAAVISKGIDLEKGTSCLKAYVTLKKGYIASTRLSQEIRMFLRGNLSPDICITDISFADELPKTRSGKLLRRVLRAWELGLPGGDAAKMND